MHTCGEKQLQGRCLECGEPIEGWTPEPAPVDLGGGDLLDRLAAADFGGRMDRFERELGAFRDRVLADLRHQDQAIGLLAEVVATNNARCEAIEMAIRDVEAEPAGGDAGDGAAGAPGELQGDEPAAGGAQG